MKLTMLSNSDIHNPLNLDYHVRQGDHRPLTLVFARDKTQAAIKEALFSRRTAVYSANRLVGEAKFLRPLFEQTVSLNRSYVELKGTERYYLQITNRSALDYELRLKTPPDRLTVPENIVLYAGKTVLFSVRAKEDKLSESQTFALPYVVENLLVAPGAGLDVELRVTVSFVPTPEE